MRKSLTLLASLFLILSLNSCSERFKPVSKEEVNSIIEKVNSSKIILLDIYHDQCGTCKLIEPTFERLKSDYSQNPDLVFLKYDLSNPFTLNNSRKISKAVDLEDIYKAQKYSGIVLFIDSKTKKVIQSLIGESNIEPYKKIIEATLNEKATTTNAQPTI